MTTTARRTPLERQIMDLGWFYDLYKVGGWCHPDVLDTYSEQIAFDTAEDVAAHLAEIGQPLPAGKHHYRMLFRPASFCTLPAGLKWEFTEVPPYITLRPDLPQSKFAHGVFSTDRALTDEELKSYEIAKVPS